MSDYNVTVDDTPLQFGLSGVEEVKQNIRTIIKTIMGTCPMHRSFGIDPIIIDMPTLRQRLCLKSLLCRLLSSLNHAPRLQTWLSIFKKINLFQSYIFR